MKPLPRLLAYLDDDIAARADVGIALAAIAAAGPRVGLVARLPHGTTDALTTLAARAVSHARPPGARVLVTGRADVALATGAHGVVLRRHDLPVAAVRDMAPACGLLRAVHSIEEARTAAAEGADGIIVGSIWPTASHPGTPPAGLPLLRNVAALGLPTWAIGGVTADRAREAAHAGAWGVAAIRALWDARRPYAAAQELLAAFD